jgi:hypothetical protein
MPMTTPLLPMPRVKGIPTDFVGPAFDSRHGYVPETGMALRYGARQSCQDKSSYRAAVAFRKYCLGCNHWAPFHPGHGPCVVWSGAVNDIPCGCPGFQDPEPGRPDNIYTRDQIDRMLRWRFERVKDRIYLMKDGNYGLLDQWTDKEKYFA